ncbi:hypothetical protein TL16_g08410 [Triparma laevis f. inornata]|uniref:Uncharacterized protein n=2 Tax=Triparma laevis TaxID=1534972 RepID=A0A9W7C3T2_9STRA|nr:hypothetical protein TL16_g08410 [Triparma laevis f. inornata]GMI01422.1 hypothetical protein TrLO_g4911 [Triparma laevis f. longispina]
MAKPVIMIDKAAGGEFDFDFGDVLEAAIDGLDDITENNESLSSLSIDLLLIDINTDFSDVDVDLEKGASDTIELGKVKAKEKVLEKLGIKDDEGEEEEEEEEEPTTLAIGNTVRILDSGGAPSKDISVLQSYNSSKKSWVCVHNGGIASGRSGLSRSRRTLWSKRVRGRRGLDFYFVSTKV